MKELVGLLFSGFVIMTLVMVVWMNPHIIKGTFNEVTAPIKEKKAGGETKPIFPVIRDLPSPVKHFQKADNTTKFDENSKEIPSKEPKATKDIGTNQSTSDPGLKEKASDNSSSKTSDVGNNAKTASDPGNKEKAQMDDPGLKEKGFILTKKDKAKKSKKAKKNEGFGANAVAVQKASE